MNFLARSRSAGLAVRRQLVRAVVPPLRLRFGVRHTSQAANATDSNSEHHESPHASSTSTSTAPTRPDLRRSSLPDFLPPLQAANTRVTRPPRSKTLSQKLSEHPVYLALLSVIDHTGLQPKATSLAELVPNPAQGARLQHTLQQFQASEEDFLSWRDIFSTSSLSDALARLLANDLPLVSADGQRQPLRWPAFIWQALLTRSSTPQSTVAVSSLFVRDCGFWTPEEHSHLLCVLMQHVVRHESLVLLPILLDVYLKPSSYNPRVQYPPLQPPDSLPMLNALRPLALNTRTSAPATEARFQIARIIKHHTSGGQRLPTGIMTFLSTPDVHSHQTRREILSYHARQREPARRKVAQACFISAVWDRDRKGAQTFFERLYPTSMVESKTDPRNFRQSELTVYEEERRMAITMLAWCNRGDSDLIANTSPDPSVDMEAQNVTRPLQSGTSVNYAWSMLLTFAGRDKRVTREQWDQLLRHIPRDSATVRMTLTPIMEGLIARGEPGLALELWERIREQAADLTDEVTLTVAVKATLSLHGLDEAVRLLDQWAKRPAWGKKENEGRVKIDAQAVNTLMEASNRLGRSAVALHLWRAMWPRYGVRQDGPTITALLDCARLADKYKEERWREAHSGFGALVEEFRQGLRAAPQPVSLDDEGDVYRAKMYEKCSADFLVSEDGGEDLTWQSGRLLFRSIVLGNWPFLASVASPLHTSSWKPSALAILGGHLYLDSPQKGTPADPEYMISRIPDCAPYAHLRPSATSFHAYILLLGFHASAYEIPLTLAWMRAIGIKPLWTTLCASLSLVADGEGPPRLITVHPKAEGSRASQNWLTDSEVLRMWLQEWLGSKAVPVENDVAAFRRRTHGVPPPVD